MHFAKSAAISLTLKYESYYMTHALEFLLQGVSGKTIFRILVESIEDILWYNNPRL